MGTTRSVGVFVFALGACGPAVIVPEDGETSTSAGDASTSPTSTSTNGASASTTSPGTTSPGTTDTPGTTADPSDPLPTTTGPVPETDGDDTSTTTPTTAGEDGGVPGGAGPDGAPDDPGDVMLPEADVLAAAVYTDGESLDFRVQLDTAPFGVEATYDITWCIATESGTDSCGAHAYNIDNYLQVFLIDGEQIEVSPDDVDPCLHSAFETETNTLRVLVPIDLFLGYDDFQWILTVTYGGSFGNNEWVPEEGALDVVVVDEFPPFSGELICD